MSDRSYSGGTTVSRIIHPSLKSNVSNREKRLRRTLFTVKVVDFTVAMMKDLLAQAIIRTLALDSEN